MYLLLLFVFLRWQRKAACSPRKHFLFWVQFIFVIDIWNELEDDTADCPHVSGDIVPLLDKYYLGCSIPARASMCRHGSFLTYNFNACRWTLLLCCHKSRSIVEMMPNLIWIEGIIAMVYGTFITPILDLFGDTLRHGPCQSEVAYLNIQSQWIN